jgi:hypothetical protein
MNWAPARPELVRQRRHGPGSLKLPIYIDITTIDFAGGIDAAYIWEVGFRSWMVCCRARISCAANTRAAALTSVGLVCAWLHFCRGNCTTRTPRATVCGDAGYVIVRCIFRCVLSAPDRAGGDRIMRPA